MSDMVDAMTRDVADSAILLQAIAGHDPRDSTSSSRPVPDYLSTLRNGVKGMRLGVPKEYFVAGMEPAVEQAVRDAIDLRATMDQIVAISNCPQLLNRCNGGRLKPLRVQVFDPRA